MSRRIWAGVLAFCLMIGFLPAGVQAALVDGADYLTQQLYLGDNLTLHLRGSVNYLYAENAVATVAYGDRVDTYRLEDLTRYEDGQYGIGIELAAAQMTEEIALTIHVGDVVVLEETYSVRDYITTLLEGEYTRQTKQLCYALLNYGAWAQEYFDVNTQNPANKGYATDIQNPIPSEIPSVHLIGGVPGISYYGTSVVFVSETAVRHYFTAPNGVAGYTFTVDGKEYTPVGKAGRYYIEIPGINPQDMDTEMTVAVSNGTDTLSFDYAPTYFFIRSYHKSADETYKGLLEAAYNYFAAAKRFESVANVGDLSFTGSTGTGNIIRVETDLPANTPIADFTLSENGCNVNESANQYQKASWVGMENASGTIALTFHFDSSFQAGQTYCLPQNALFCFTDDSQYALTRDYIFLFDGSNWTSVEPAGNFLSGVGFEKPGNALLFTGEGSETVAIAGYGDLGISAPASGGSYALKLSNTDTDSLCFRIHFGQELAARTQLSFAAYSSADGVFTFSAGKAATEQLDGKNWTKLSVTLPEDTEYLDLVWKLDDTDADVQLLLDNFLAVQPVEPENLLLGFDSYEELTGAKLSVGNMLGRMEINRNIDYITQGKASLKVSPQGDYNRQGAHPYFRLDLVDTTCGFSDFSNMKRICFDVYNGEDQTLRISAGLVTGEDSEAYLTTNKQTFTLAPNAWTTCSYDLSYMAGYGFYDLSNVRYMRFEFPDHKQSREDVPNTLYIDNLRADAYADGEGPVQPDFDYAAGVGFEVAGQDCLVTGQGIENRDADIERIVYYSTGTVAAPAGGGSYGLRLSHESNYWPTFRLHFGQTLPAGTELSFMAYGKIYGKNLYNQSVFEFSSGGDATEEFACGQWTQLYLTLPKDAEYIDLFWNIDRANITAGSASGQVYIDNIQFVQPEPYGDILAGYGFEERGNAERFTGQGDTTNDATIKRFTYANLGIDAPTDGGEYALKLTHSSSQTPTFRINFGRELAAGTEITFMAYAKLNSGYVYPKKNVIKYSDGTNATNTFDFKVWKTLTVTLPEDAEYIDLTWSFKGTFGTAVCELYIDNIKATEPEIVPAGDFIAGVDFEEKGNAELFTGQGLEQDATIERVSYADANVTAPEGGGSYAVKVSHASQCWPSFRINFGKTLTAGTTITFDFYGNYDYEAAAGVNKYMKLELTADSKKFATSADSNQVLWTLVETWRTGVTITLTAESDHVDFFYNVADGQHGEVASWILLDNFKATEPADSTEPDDGFSQGVDFETEGDEQWFIGQGVQQDATIERVSYADANVAAPANGGSYALKVSHASHCWPSFRINFGKTLAAGTTITFDFYGNYDYQAAAGVNKYMKLELTTASKNFATSADSNQVVWTLVETWKTSVTITLTAETDYVDFFYNVADGQHGEVPSWILLDNFKAVEP